MSARMPPRAGPSTPPMCSATTATAAPYWCARGSTACATPSRAARSTACWSRHPTAWRATTSTKMVLLEEWARAGCATEFLDRPMSDDPHDHLLLQIRGAVAEYERTLIAERMRRGRLAKLRAGLLLPWTYAPYGYRMSPDRPRDPRGVTTDPAEAAVADPFAMYRQPGLSLVRL